MSRRSRRAGERSSTAAAVPRRRVWSSARWSQVRSQRPHLAEDPVDLLAIGRQSVLGPEYDIPVTVYNRKSFGVHPLPLAKQPRRGFESRVHNVAREVLTVRAPKRALFCVQRKQRRQVIFATGKSGRNGARRYRRTSSSNYRC